jgi:hypothetical protein
MPLPRGFVPPWREIEDSAQPPERTRLMLEAPGAFSAPGQGFAPEGLPPRPVRHDARLTPAPYRGAPASDYPFPAPSLAFCARFPHLGALAN